MKKKLIMLGVIIFVVIVATVAMKDVVTLVIVENSVKMVTGLPIKMDKIDISLVHTTFDIEGLKLYNSPGFEDKVMFDMPRIYVDYDLPALLREEIYLTELRVHLKEFIVVKNVNGELNLDSLRTVQELHAGKKKSDTDKADKDFQIDSLELKIGKVVYKDYSKGGKPSVMEFTINIDEKFKNVSSPNQVASLIIVKALTNTTIARLTNFDLKGLSSQVGDVLGTAQKVVGSASDVAAKTVQQAHGTVKATTGAIAGTTGGLTNAIKLPFGVKKKEETAK
jgi:hypothetical protein